MRKLGIAALAVAAASAALAAAASSRAPSVFVPQVAAKPAKGEGAMLAVVPGARGPVLGRLDKRALWIARRSPRLRIFNTAVAWAYSPDRTQLALGTDYEGASFPVASLQWIDPVALTRAARTTKLGDGDIASMAWSGDRVNLVLRTWCCPGSFEVVGVSSRTHKVISRQRFERNVVDVRRAGGTLVILTSPETGIGAASLLVVDPDGAIRTAALDQIAAGLDVPDESGSAATLRQSIPGLAVDPDAGRVFVAAGDGAIAEISLATLAVAYHALATPVSLLGRVHEWLEPTAEAKGLNGPIREARWLGGGILAVTGTDETATRVGEELRISRTPIGLRLVDTSTWASKLVDHGADEVHVDGGLLLATGSRIGVDQAESGMGIAVYGFDGVRRVAALQGEAAYVDLSFRGRAYLSLTTSQQHAVVDLTTGAVAARRTPIADVLISPSTAP
jgi:hypothetical protein